MDVMIEIHSVSGQINIEVLRVQVEPSSEFGAMLWKVAVRTENLSGQHDEIYIMPTDYKRFLQELITLEQVRQGTASLTSASPEDLQLTFQSLDRSGHFMLEGQLGHYTYVGERLCIQKLIFAFDFDPSSLPQLVRQFSAFPELRL